jgi:hypothetical protein
VTKKISFLTEARRTESQSVRNEAANFVLAYCITAMFLIKNQSNELKPIHFFTLAHDYFAKGKKSINFNSMESASSTYDQITLRAPVSAEATKFINDNILANEEKEYYMVRSIIKYLNEDPNFGHLVSTTTNNGITNHIVVDIDNLSTSSGVASTILIDNNQVNIMSTIIPVYDFSSGIGGLGQKELAKDYGYECQREFLESMFSIDLGHDSGVYYQTAHNNGKPTVESIEAATRQMYEMFCKKLNDGFGGAYDSALNDFRQNLLSCMVKNCYGTDDMGNASCILLCKEKMGYESFVPSQLITSLYNSKLHAKCPEHINPSIRIVDGDKNELFQLRFKKERYKDNITGHRYKMYFTPSKVGKYFTN